MVAAYIEGFKDGRTLMLAADHAAQRGVPIVSSRSGAHEAGRSMAKSHTGHLTGSDAVTSAVFRQFGVTRVDGLDELQDTAAMLARAAPPIGDGVCIYAISGGTGAHMADLAAEGRPRACPTSRPRRRRRCTSGSPTTCGSRTRSTTAARRPPTGAGRKILDAIVADPNVGVIICPITGALASMSKPLGA